jgi:hypothetical protein
MTPKQVRLALLSQPALVSEMIEQWERSGRAYAIGLLALRLGCGIDAAAAGFVRYLRPSSRAEGLYWYCLNGGTRRQYESALLSVSATWCGNWPITRRVLEWREDQYAQVRSAIQHLTRVKTSTSL